MLIVLIVPDCLIVRMFHYRQQNKGRKREPQTLEDIGDLDDEFKETISGQPFLLKEVSEGKEGFLPDCLIVRIFTGDVKLLIFGTRRNMSYLCDSKYWILDGTFKVAPKIFISSLPSTVMWPQTETKYSRWSIA